MRDMIISDNLDCEKWNLCNIRKAILKIFMERLLVCSVYLLQALMIVGWYKQDNSDIPEIVDLLIRNKPLLEELEFLNSNKTVLALFVEIGNEN
jgi:hypothetical protein